MRPWVPDLLGLLWVLAAAGAVVAPALAHGSSLGPFDLLSQVGLTKQPGVVVHNQQTGDLIRLFIPWSALAWTQVHHGQLPLWDPYSALGMPLAFNWESAPFSLPALLGYLVPLRFAYTVGVLATLVIAGTGVYVLARLLRHRCTRFGLGRHRLRVERSVHGQPGLAPLVGDVVGRVVVRRCHPGRAGSPPSP